MTIYCLKPERNGTSHAIHERCPGYPARCIALLRPAHGIETEGHGWVVYDEYGHVYRGDTPDESLEAFDLYRPRSARL